MKIMSFLYRYKYADWFLIILFLFLSIIGWVILYSASIEEYKTSGINYSYKQFIWLCVAITVFFLFSGIDYRFLMKFCPLFYSLLVFLLVLVLWKGVVRYGAKRWLYFLGISVQPSELAKPLLIMFFSWCLTQKMQNVNNLRSLFYVAILLAIPLLLILKQPDLGTAVVFIPVFGIMLFITGLKWRYLISIVLLGIFLSPCGWFLMKDYQKKRLIAFLNPYSDPLGSGYSVIQSKIAIGAGGVLGKGWLQGTQNRLNFLPERHTDFIFSVLGEEWGFLGACIVVLLYFLIIAIGFDIARKTTDLRGRILVVGLISMFAIQVLINIGMTTGIMPVTGIPLPFMSYGGTSLVVNAIILGMINNVHMSRYA